MKLKGYTVIFCALFLSGACNPDGPDNPGKPVTVDPWEGATIYGTVRDTGGNPIGGAVVSDGHICCATDANGRYGLKSEFENVTFVWVSTPSGYSAAVNEYSLPVFYKRLDTLYSKGGVYSNIDFAFKRIDNPDRFTLFLSADPQPRSSSASYDKIGYHAFDCVTDMCRDFKETAAKRTNPVYGIVLGDVCHNDVSLYPTYRTKMASNGFPTYHVIGNHDHNLSTIGDIESAKKFESYFGPSNYSFNLGNCHIVVLDNMMVVSKKRDTNSDEDLCDGLRDDIWEWFRNDMSFVDESKTIMICVHSPMFYTLGGGKRTRGTINFDGKQMSNHYGDVDALLAKYAKVYAWAGHTHATYNYVNVADPRLETHTLVRVTGQLWTNEWESAGTPRGYVILDYDGGTVSWKFHPIPYQSGTCMLSTPPAYTYREWTYEKGVAKMKETEAVLDESYQMHVFAPGTYAAGDNLVYANIFLWDELWKTPTFTTNGSTSYMKRVTTSGKYLSDELSSKEVNSWYKKYSSTLSNDSSYSADPGRTASMFTASVNQTHGSGTVKVKDRFGNTYQQTVKW